MWHDDDEGIDNPRETSAIPSKPFRHMSSDLPPMDPSHSNTSYLSSFWYRPRFLYTMVFIWISISGGRFLAEFLEQEVDLSPSQIGGMLALQKAVGVLSSSVAGYVADIMEERYGPNRGRLSALGLGVVVSTICFCLHGSYRLFNLLSGKATTTPPIPTNVTIHDDAISTAVEDEDSNNEHPLNSLPFYILLRVLYAVAGSFVYPVLDSLCIAFLKRNGRQEDYGKERLWGAISWAVANLTIGPILDYFDDFAILYPLSVLSMAGVLLCLYIYSRGTPSNYKCTQSNLRSNYSKIKRRTSDLVSVNDDEYGENSAGNQQGVDLSLNRRTIAAEQEDPQQAATNKLGFFSVFLLFGSSLYSIAFLVGLVTLASGQAVVNDLVFLLFEYLGSTYSLMSLTVVLTVAFEIPLFQIAPLMLDKLGSSGLFLLAAICYVFRVIGYTLIPTGKTAWVLLLEPLHGVTYAASQTANVNFAANIVYQPGSESLAQGCLQFFSGLGAVLGLGLGGWIQQRWGPVVMYRLSALFVVGGAFLFLLALLIVKIGLGRKTPLSRIQHHALPQEDDAIVACGRKTSDVEMTSCNGQENDNA